MSDRKGPKGFVDVVSRVRRATVLVGTCDLIQNNNQLTATNIQASGSGFFISGDGLLLTAKHVIPATLQGHQRYFIFHKENETSAWWATSNTLIHDFQDLDVCAIKFNRRVNCIPIAQRKSKQGDEIGIFGYPAAQLNFVNGQFNGATVVPRASNTTISSAERTSKVFGSTVNFVDKKLVESQFIFVKGNSGGPVFEKKTGKIIGIVTGVDNIPQTAVSLTHTQNGNATNFLAAPFASYSYAISIEEVLPRLQRGTYTHWWK